MLASSFDPLNPEFTPGYRIISTFSNCFSFHSFNKHNNDSLLSRLCQLDSLTIVFLENPLHTLTITDTNIRNNVATSITHIHIHDRPVIKTLHYIVNINSMEAELFAIRYSIYQATSFYKISKIVIVIDSIHSAKRIFDSLSHPFQIHAMSILCKLQNFFKLNQDNLIKFWECPSRCNLSRSLTVDSVFIFLFFVNFIFPFPFLFLEQLGLGFTGHAVTSVTN